VPFDASPEIGVMIEVPSAVLMGDELAREADFLSVGSNDLIQYLLAIDRDNEALIEHYQPLHPAVLRALRQIVEAAHRHGKTIAMCGEMAGDPMSVPILVGLGFDRLSVAPYMIPEIKQTVRSLELRSCRELAAEALTREEPAEVYALISERLGSTFSDLLSLFGQVNGTQPRRAREDQP
jgi:phosphotransferase system enzyme I (PtsI)